MGEKILPTSVQDALIKDGATTELIERLQSTHPRDTAWRMQLTAYLNNMIGTFVPAQITKTKARTFEPLGSFLDENIFYHIDKSVWDMGECSQRKLYAEGATFQSWDIAKAISLDDAILDLGINCQSELQLPQVFGLIDQTHLNHDEGPLLPDGSANWFIIAKGYDVGCLRVIAELGRFALHIFTREQMYSQDFAVGDRIHTLAW